MHDASLRWIGTVNTAGKSGVRSGLVGRSGVISGRIACVLAVALLACASSAHSQVIEEGGFPVKGGDNSGEPFSLSCSSRLVVQAGSSIVLSCSATAVPEEGVRYEWESISVGGLDFLSAPDELSPLFMAPSSGAGEKYAYRLTATAPGVYETADVTVSVEGFSGDSAHDRGEGSAGSGDCSSFAFEGYREGCSSKDEGSQPFAPFGGFPGEEGGLEFPFPGSPGAPEEGLPGLLQAGDPAQQTAPYLDCPPAVFLEELEVGSIECHVSDAVGEEFLEYVWEPVGSTTRDYMDNPRLTPEDSPYPLVVAPEAPHYETLEASRSGETSVRYQYRLTATSRATGLSSFSEVDVFVSGSRPSVFCPSEVEVEEGGSVVLECAGVDPLSRRLDYDEASSPVVWSWAGLWETSTAPLLSTEVAAPVFEAPPGSAGRQYHYIAGMTSSSSGAPLTARRRVTVTVTGAEEVEQAAEDAAGPPLTCADYSVYTGDPDFKIECVIDWYDAHSPRLDTWLWSNNPDQAFPGDHTERLSDVWVREPIFDVPDSLPEGQESMLYEYEVNLRYCVYGGHWTWKSAQADVRVYNQERPFEVTCPSLYEAYEGTDDFTLACSAAGVPDGVDLTYAWTARGGTANTEQLSDTDILTPTFSVPENLNGDTQYEYTLTASGGTDQVRANVTVKILERLDITNCGPSGGQHKYRKRYEGSGDDVRLGCQYPPPPYRHYTYEWTVAGGTPATALDRLSDPHVHGPWFYIPDEVSEDTDYRYRFTITAKNADPFTRVYVIPVLNKPSLVLRCGTPYEVQEGDDDIRLECSASGAPGEDPDYQYRWTGNYSAMALLDAGKTASPAFAVPDEIDEDETYEYKVAVWAKNAEPATAQVTVTVLNKKALALVCTPPAPMYEGSADFDLGCSATGAPAGSDYAYAWTASGSTPDTALLIAGTDGPAPTFAVPEKVDADETYEYLLTVTAENAKPATAQVTVTVLNKKALALVCTQRYETYEGSEDFSFDCAASGAPSGSDYAYAWTASGNTPDTALLTSGTNGPTPTFDVPEEVDEDETYEYLLTVSAENAESGTANVTVTVLNKKALALVCTQRHEAYEGSEDISFDCAASDAPSGSDYAYAWTASGNTPDTALLTSGTNGPTPTFDVPEEVDEDETYEYLLTVSAENAESGTANVTVTVLNKKALALVCTQRGFGGRTSTF